MSCRIKKTKNGNAFQCSNIGEFNYMNDGIYNPDECEHNNRFDNKGVFTCKDCGATYHEDNLSWY